MNPSGVQQHIGNGVPLVWEETTAGGLHMAVCAGMAQGAGPIQGSATERPHAPPFKTQSPAWKRREVMSSCAWPWRCVLCVWVSQWEQLCVCVCVSVCNYTDWSRLHLN